jgi:hypothetical protein
MAEQGIELLTAGQLLTRLAEVFPRQARHEGPSPSPTLLRSRAAPSTHYRCRRV